MARIKGKTSTKNRGTAPPLNRERLRQRVERAQWDLAERQARVDECRRCLRRFKTPPDALFQVWVEDCMADGVDPVEMLHNLSRPLKVRLTELIGERPEGSDDDFEPPKDRDLSRFYHWDVFDDPERDHLATELVSYREEIKEEWQNWQARRSTWRVAEWGQAEVLVKDLRAIIRRVNRHIRELTGDEPKSDQRISEVWPLLREVEQRLSKLSGDRPKAERKGRPMVGPEKNWATKVENEVFQRLEKLRPWKKDDYDSKTEHIRMLGRLSEKIVKRLGIRPKRGIDSAYR